jgi:hypothetical protein
MQREFHRACEEGALPRSIDWNVLVRELVCNFGPAEFALDCQLTSSWQHEGGAFTF